MPESNFWAYIFGEKLMYAKRVMWDMHPYASKKEVRKRGKMHEKENCESHVSGNNDFFHTRRMWTE